MSAIFLSHAGAKVIVYKSQGAVHGDFFYVTEFEIWVGFGLAAAEPFILEQ